jgi:hypothetical protein
MSHFLYQVSCLSRRSVRLDFCVRRVIGASGHVARITHALRGRYDCRHIAWKITGLLPYCLPDR